VAAGELVDDRDPAGLSSGLPPDPVSCLPLRSGAPPRTSRGTGLRLDLAPDSGGTALDKDWSIVGASRNRFPDDSGHSEGP